MLSKRGQTQTLYPTIEFIIVLAIAGILAYAIFNLEDEAKLNKIKAEDVALILDTVSIPSGDFELNYELKDRRIIFDENEVNLFKEDRLKEGEARFNADVTSGTEAVGFLHITKEEDSVGIS